MCLLPVNLKKRSAYRNGLVILALVWALGEVWGAQGEFFETLPDGKRPPEVAGATDGEASFPGADRQCQGALSGRIVFTCAGHGWTCERSGWTTQRPIGHHMNEDYGNLDQMNLFIPYAFNAGATVVAFRPIGYQPSEVVLDNISLDVRFSGKWFNSRSEVYFGRSGAVPYRFALLGKTETATATYTPRIPAAGFYPVYTWVRHGADRTSQLYRILHTGGQTLVRVPHQRVGNGWVYLGTYYFEAGRHRKTGAVIVSNLQPSPGFGAVAVADAIRFGNGMGDTLPVPGGHVSTYPREEEASRYWVLSSLGQGQGSILMATTNDQQTSNVSAPPRMARAMNRVDAGNMFKRIYVGFHSNSGGGRGVLGLWNNARLFPGTETPNQRRLAQLMGAEVNDTLSAIGVPPLEVPWFKRAQVTYARDDYAFGEINNKIITNEFDATILEVAFHDNAEDAKLLCDPKVRERVGRCAYQAIVRYMHEFDGVPLRFLSEPPRHLRAADAGNAVLLTWDAPNESEAGAAESYLIYRSEDGYGFGRPIRVPATQTCVRLADLRRGKPTYFRVTAENAGGESLPSTVTGCLPREKRSAARVLYVNGFTQLDRLNNPRQTIGRANYLAPSAVGKVERVHPRLNNAFDYVVQYGKALGANGVAFDSCERGAVASGDLQLDQYKAVIWASGQQTTNLIDAHEHAALSRYLSRSGNLLLTGSHVAEALGPPAEGSNDLGRQIHAIPAQQDGASARYLSFIPAEGGVFALSRPVVFGDAADQSYYVNAASRLRPKGLGARVALYCPDGTAAAGVQYDGSAGGGRVICLGFPFECVSLSRVRSQIMGDAMRFLAEDRLP